MMMKSFGLFLLVLGFPLLTSSTVLAQNPFYINFDIDDGLPSSEVYDVHITQDGRLFLTTDRGVCTYDGYEFQTYSTQDGLTSNTNFQIIEDFRGRLWLNGMERSLSIYENNEFRAFEYNHLLDSVGHELWIGDLIFDPDGSIYFGRKFSNYLDFVGLIKDGETYTLQYEDFLPAFEQVQNANGLHFYKRNGIAFFSCSRSGFKNNHYPYRLERLHDNWVGFQHNRVWLFSDAGELLDTVQFDVVLDGLYVDRAQNLWLCSYEGLYCYQGGDLAQPAKRFFKNLSITNMIQDFEGNYWLSTLTNGVLLVPNFDIKVLGNIDSKLNSERILHTVGLQSNVIFATSEGRIGHFDEQLDFHWLKGDYTLGSQFANIYNKGDTVYLSAFYNYYEKEEQLHAIDFFTTELYPRTVTKAGRKLFRWPGDLRYSFGFFVPLNSGDYFAINEKGFLIYTPTELINTSQSRAGFDKKVTDFYEEKDGTIWLSTTEGLYKIEHNDYHHPRLAFPEINDQLGRVQEMVFDSRGNLWIATIGNGVFYKQANQLHQVTQKEGLKSNIINCIYLDDKEKLWLGTNQGVDALTYTVEEQSFKLDELRNYTIHDGLSSNYVNDITYANDHYWLATNRGMTYFKETDLVQTYPLVPLYFDQLIVNGEVKDFQNELILHHDENDVYIKFTGISHRKDQEYFYQYRLNTESTAQEWFFTNDRSVRYNDLQPGKYTFELSAQNKAGVWTQPIASLSFEIDPHFSQTLWFAMCIIIVGIGLLVWIGYGQLKRVQQKEEQKRQLQKVEYRMREAELAALRNQMNPHFVFNALNSIQHFIFKKEVESANYFLAKFARLMRDSLEFSRIEYISLEEELNFLKNYLELEMLRFPDKFTYQIKLDQRIKPAAYLIPSLMLQPVLENAVKHAFRDIDYEGLIEISVEIYQPHHCLRIKIRD
ncbi:MAG: histidine kinase, partial [Bacteroidota bacterium]